MPRVSVVIAAYNAQRFLREAIDSVLAQTFGDFELVVVDDGSKDSTPQILDDYAARDSRVRVIHQENKGVTRSGNIGVKAAVAPLIARMDADDWCVPDRLAKQVAFMDAHPQVVLLGGAYELVDEKNRKLRTMVPSLDNASLQEQCLTGRTPICHPLCMFRADAAAKVGFYDESFPCALDIDLYLRLGEVGEMACIPDVLLKYRQHAGSISESKQTLQVKMMKRACELAWARRSISDREFMVADGWRSDGSAKALFDQHLRYGWWAFHAHNRWAMLVYGVKAIRLMPTKSQGYKLLACGLVKPLPSGMAQ